MTYRAAELTCETGLSIGDIPAEQWDRIAPSDAPFVQWEFLDILENTGCVGPGTGWFPNLLALWRTEEGPGETQRKLVGALPLYIKHNSAGEFVFDWGWADAAQRAGISYYPKAVVAIPFTPVPGPRILVDESSEDPEALRDRLIREAFGWATSEELSSLHFNFVEESDRETLRELGCAIRLGFQYHWHNGGPFGDEASYDDFDDFLGRLRSKKRSNIKREQRKLAERDVTLHTRTGDDITAGVMQRMFSYYKDTVEKFFYGRQYLNLPFFEAVGRRMSDVLHVVEAEHDGHCYGGALNFFGRDRLFGRYWGQTRDIKYTHFNVCFYEGIRWAIDQGLSVFEGGSGGDHKYDRGFMPTETFSAHWARHPGLHEGIEDFIGREEAAIRREIERITESTPFKQLDD
jgi:hypothetical protein